MYGFRLYDILLLNRNGSNPEYWNTQEFNYINHCTDSIQYMKERNPLENIPWRTDIKLKDVASADHLLIELDNPPIANTRVGRISYQKINEMLLLNVMIGKVGSYPIALKPKEDIEISKTAPAREYRCVIIPGIDCKKGTLAVESIGRFCPYNDIISLLRSASRVYGIRPSAEAFYSDNWWRLRANQIGDTEYLKEVLSGDTARINLRKSSRPGSKTGESSYLKLEASITGSKLEKLKNRITSLASNGEIESMPIFSSALEMLEFVDDSDHLEELDFSDGYISIESPEGRTKIKPGNPFTDLFTYQISKERPDLRTWLEKVNSRLCKLKPNILPINTHIQDRQPIRL